MYEQFNGKKSFNEDDRDDSDMLDEQLPYFVHTNSSVGITDEDYKKIEEILYQ